jgi:precorrin-2/cobalt-factor-2 C20-methyltransferase
MQTNTVLALLKLGQRWFWLQPLLKTRGLLANCLFAQRVGWPDQLIVGADQVSPEERPYFSLLLIRFNWPEVLP